MRLALVAALGLCFLAPNLLAKDKGETVRISFKVDGIQNKEDMEVLRKSLKEVDGVGDVGVSKSKRSAVLLLDEAYHPL